MCDTESVAAEPMEESVREKLSATDNTDRQAEAVDKEGADDAKMEDNSSPTSGVGGSVASVERLYELCEILDSASNNDPDKMSSCFADSFCELLTGVKGEKKQKQLSCQFIMRFFKFFVDQETIMESVLDCLFDLCEDEDASIRRQAIKELSNICKFVPGIVARISDILAQLLQAEDSIEYAVVQSSLLQLVKIDPKQCIIALFSQILTASQTGGELIRERTIKFLATKLPSLPPDVLTVEIEDILIEKIRQTLVDVTCQEFNTFVKILSSLKQMQNNDGRERLVDIIAAQAGILGDDKNDSDDFDPKDLEKVVVLVQCTKQALDFFSRNVPSTKFTVYFCTNVLPRVWELPVKSDDSSAGNVSQIDVLKLLAEMSSTCSTIEIDCIEHVYNALVRLLPEKPSDEDTKTSTGGVDLPNLMLSHLECLLFTFHTLAKHHNYIRCEQSTENFKKLRPNLVYLSSGLQHHINKLRKDISDYTQEELKEPENTVKVTALKVTLNITLLAKDLTRLPPTFDTTVTLSWKRASSYSSAGKSSSKKRPHHSGYSNEEQGSNSRGQVYNPPSGKYSRDVHSFESKYKPGYKGSKYKLGVYYA